MGTNFFRFDKASFKRTLSILNHIFHEHADQQQGFKETIKANLDIFFIELARRPVETSPARTVSFMQERLDEFVRLLEIHICDHKKVSDYADMLNVSPYQLNTATKTYFRKTSSQMIDQQIILESKRFLLGTSNQVSQIALHLGYEDVSYFIRFFKKHTGYTPESFRHNFR